MPARVELLQRCGKGRPGRWLVILEGREIGLIERWNGDRQPWCAYAGIGRESRPLGAFYPDGVTFTYCPETCATHQRGGRDAAIAAVVAACKAVAA